MWCYSTSKSVRPIKLYNIPHNDKSKMNNHYKSYSKFHSNKKKVSTGLWSALKMQNRNVPSFILFITSTQEQESIISTKQYIEFHHRQIVVYLHNRVKISADLVSQYVYWKVLESGQGPSSRMIIRGRITRFTQKNHRRKTHAKRSIILKRR